MAIESINTPTIFGNRESLHEQGSNTLSADALTGELSNSLPAIKDFVMPTRAQGLYLTESYGIDVNSISISAEGHILGTPRIRSGTAEIFEEFKKIGVNPIIEIFHNGIVPREILEKLGINKPVDNNQQLIVLSDKKFSLRKDNSIPLGYVLLNSTKDLDSLDLNQNLVEIKIIENIHDRKNKQEVFRLTNETLRCIAIDQIDSLFREVLSMPLDETFLSSEKTQLLSQINTLLEDITDIGDIEFLRNFQKSIIEGVYDETIQIAIKDQIISLVTTQLVAAAAPFIGSGIGALTNDPGLGVKTFGAIYFYAPLPSWIYILAKRGEWSIDRTENTNPLQYAKETYQGVIKNIASRTLKDYLLFGGSFIAMHLPIGSFTAFPLSLSLQKKDEMERLKQLVYSNERLRKEINWRRKFTDYFLFNDLNKKISYANPQLLDDNKVEKDLGIKLKTFFRKGKLGGVEIVEPVREEEKSEAAQFAASQYLLHNLSNINDPELENIGTEDSPIFRMKDYNKDNVKWLLSRDQDTRSILVSGRFINSHQGEVIPMKEELLHRENLVETGILDRIRFINPEDDLSVLNNIDFELGKVAFNLKAYGDPKGSMEASWKYSLGLLSWIRGIYMHMEDNNIEKFGAVLSTEAESYLRLLGNLGLEAITEPFYYLPEDKENNITSRIQIVNMQNAKEIMRKLNPEVYEFVINNKVNDSDVRKRIWLSLVNRVNTPKATDSLSKRIKKTARKVVGRLNTATLTTM